VSNHVNQRNARNGLPDVRRNESMTIIQNQSPSGHLNQNMPKLEGRIFNTWESIP